MRVCVRERETERDQYCIGMEPENALAWEQSSLPQPPDLLDDIEICADKKKDIYPLHYRLKSFSLRLYVPTYCRYPTIIHWIVLSTSRVLSPGRANTEMILDIVPE